MSSRRLSRMAYAIEPGVPKWILRASHSQVSCISPPPSATQQRRCGILAAWIDRLAMHAAPVARLVGADLRGHSDAVTGVEVCAGRDQPHGLAAVSQMCAHPRSIALEASAGGHQRVSRQGLAGAGLLDHKTDDAVVLHDDFPRTAVVAECDARVHGRLRQDLD